MGDTTNLVEYWSRDEYMNIDVHADIDEAMLQDEGVVRCPKVGHVLYLQIKNGLHCPTCVFPSEQIGWGLNESDDPDAEKEMVIVPAVQGRILRFPGNAMHAVPSPHDRWLLSREEEVTLRENEEKCKSVYDDDDDDDDGWMDDVEDDENDDEIERSVLLFNTWPDHQPGPRWVNGDIATGSLPDGIELGEEDAQEFLNSQFAEWEEEYGRDGRNVRCNPLSKWKSVDIEETGIEPVENEEQSDRITVSLMGNQKRRLYPKRYADLMVPRQKMEKALTQDSAVTRIRLAVDGDTEINRACHSIND
jgi:hypothetical protein